MAKMSNDDHRPTVLNEEKKDQQISTLEEGIPRENVEVSRIFKIVDEIGSAELSLNVRAGASL